MKNWPTNLNKTKAIKYHIITVILIQVKSEGYDGNDSQNESASQWNFSGALLYSVTIITTIGKYNFIYVQSANQHYN